MRVMLVVNPRKPSFPPYLDMSLLSLVSNLGEHQATIYDLFMDLLATRRSALALLREAIQDFRPDLVALGAMSYQFAAAQRIATFVKAAFPRVKTVLGGWHLTGVVEEGLPDEDYRAFDFLIYGQGEATLTELCDALDGEGELSTIPGLLFRDGDRFVRNAWRKPEAGAVLHPPKRDAYLNLERMRPIMRRYFTSHQGEATRGCPHACSYCTNLVMNRGVILRFPVERVIEDMKAVQRLGGRSYIFTDENVLEDPDYFERLCLAILDHKLNGMHLMAGVSTESVVRRPELIPLARDAGFLAVGVGAESVLSKNLVFFNKSWSAPDLHRRPVEILNQAGLIHVSFLIIGVPEDDEQRIRYQFQIMQQLGTTPFPFFLTPLPGTRLKRQVEGLGLIRIKDLSYYDTQTAVMDTLHLSIDQLEAIRRKELLRYYLTSGFLARLFPRGGKLSFGLALRYLAGYLPLHARSLLHRQGERSVYDWFRW